MTHGLQLRHWSSPADPSARAVELLQGNAEGKSFSIALARLAHEIEGTAFLIVRVDEVDCAEIHQAINAFQRTAGGTRLCLAGTHSTLERLGSNPFDSDRVGWMLDDIDVTTPWSEIVSEHIEAIRFCPDFVARAGRNMRLGLVLEAMLLLARDLGLCALGSARCTRWRWRHRTSGVRLYAAPSRAIHACCCEGWHPPWIPRQPRHHAGSMIRRRLSGIVTDVPCR